MKKKPTFSLSGTIRKALLLAVLAVATTLAEMEHFGWAQPAGSSA